MAAIILISSGEQQDPGEWDGHLRGGGGGEGWCGDQVSLGVKMWTGNQIKIGEDNQKKVNEVRYKFWFVIKALKQNTKHNLYFHSLIGPITLSKTPALMYLEIKLDIQLQ